jgi:hypothetical protein
MIEELALLHILLSLELYFVLQKISNNNSILLNWYIIAQVHQCYYNIKLNSLIHEQYDHAKIIARSERDILKYLIIK